MVPTAPSAFLPASLFPFLLRRFRIEISSPEDLEVVVAVVQVKD